MYFAGVEIRLDNAGGRYIRSKAGMYAEWQVCEWRDKCMRKIPADRDLSSGIGPQAAADNSLCPSKVAQIFAVASTSLSISS